MGITEFRESLAPRSQMNKTFFPFKPMLPSASARFIMNGMSTSVERATPIPVFRERSKKLRRVISLILGSIKLLFFETLQGHEVRNHASHARVVSCRGSAQRAERVHRAIVRRVQEIDGRRAISIQIGFSFPRVNDAQEIIHY